MKYTVIWRATAEEELADLWLKAEDRNAMAEMADRMDNLLRRDAHELGESRSEGVRILVIPPLGVEFEVQEADRMVYVLSIWRFRLGPR